MENLEKYDLYVCERSSVCGAVFALDLESGRQKAHATVIFGEEASAITIVQWDNYAEFRDYVEDFIAFECEPPKVGEVVQFGSGERAVGLW